MTAILGRPGTITTQTLDPCGCAMCVVPFNLEIWDRIMDKSGLDAFLKRVDVCEREHVLRHAEGTGDCERCPTMLKFFGREQPAEVGEDGSTCRHFNDVSDVMVKMSARMEMISVEVDEHGASKAKQCLGTLVLETAARVLWNYALLEHASGAGVLKFLVILLEAHSSCPETFGRLPHELLVNIAQYAADNVTDHCAPSVPDSKTSNSDRNSIEDMCEFFKRIYDLLALGGRKLVYGVRLDCDAYCNHPGSALHKRLVEVSLITPIDWGAYARNFMGQV